MSPKKRAQKLSLYPTCVLAALAALALLCTPAHAGEPPESHEERLRRLETLLEAERQQIAALRTELRRTQERLQEDTSGHPLPDWFENIALSGVIEVEAGYASASSDASDTPDGSDLALATFELGVAADITDWLQGEAVLLWEEDETESVDLDVGIIRLGGTERWPVYLEAGKMYPPFGRFDSFFITDPVVLELGEMRETALTAGGVLGPVELSLSVFNGEVEEAGDTDDHLEKLVAAAAFARESEDGALAFNAGVAWVSDLTESDGLQELVSDGAGAVEDYVPAVNFWAGLRWRRFSLVAEYLGALDHFEPNELSLDGGGTLLAEAAEPKAWNLEAALAVSEKLTFAAKYERARDAFSWQHERRWGGCASYTLCETEQTSATLSLEYLHGRFDDVDDSSEDLATLQLGIEF